MEYVQPVGGAANDPYITGDPQAGTPGSQVPGPAIEHVQREILKVITGAGLVADGGNLTQLEEAINKQILSLGLNRGHIDGLLLSNNGGDPTNKIDVSVGEAIDDGTSFGLRRTATLTKQINLSWTVGDDQGGLDAGAIADGWYDKFLIGRPDTGVIDALFTTAGSGPTMPADYTKKRLIGSVLRVGGALVPFTMLPNGVVLWDAPVMDGSAVGKTTNAALHQLQTPAGRTTGAIVAVQPHQTALSTLTMYGLVTSPLQADTAPSSTLFNMKQYRSIANYSNNHAFSGVVQTDTLSQIRTRWTSATGTQDLLTTGYIDPRGSDA